MRNLERFWQSTILRKIPNALFPSNPSIVVASETFCETFLLRSGKVSPNLHFWSRINSVYVWKSYICVTKNQLKICMLVSWVTSDCCHKQEQISSASVIFWHQGVWWTCSVKRNNAFKWSTRSRTAYYSGRSSWNLILVYPSTKEKNAKIVVSCLRGVENP